MKSKNTKAHNGQRPNLSFIRDEVDLEGMGYTPEQIKALWESVRPKKSANDVICELLFGTAGIVEEGQRFDISPVSDLTTLNDLRHWKTKTNNKTEI